MLSEETDHLECLRLRSFTPRRLSLTYLLRLLRQHNGSDNKQKQNVNGKRAREKDDLPSRKRVKLSTNKANLVPVPNEERLVHVYRRIFRIRYTTSTLGHAPCVDDEEAEESGWVRDEQALQEWLTAFFSANDDANTVDLGPVSIDEISSDRNSPAFLRNPEDYLSILTLPSLHSSFKLDDYDFSQRTKPMRDPLQAFQILADAGRARINAHLFLVALPEHQSDEMPFTLHVELDCFFVCPQIFAPVMPATKPSENARAADIQEAQRRLVVHLFPPQSPPPAPYYGTTDIPFLFSILCPAPALPSSEAHDALQPDSLLPNLLPFQRRSVAWMLDREGKTVSALGAVVTKSDVAADLRSLPLFWDQFPISTDETWYVNRLRGLISSTRPTGEDDELDEDALGGIVAEEPGLGKTLECISTIILNPARDRSPVNKRWDALAKIDVREIKATLIVTPPSLAPQWADELAAHAPGLKVLIYEGWQKVPVPISERDVALEREKRKKQKLRTTTVSKSEPKGKRRPAKGKGKRKSRTNSDESETDEDEGAMAVDDEDEEILDWCGYVNTFDVCITTYNVLQQDLGVARPPPTRPRRAFVQYSTLNRSRSPLVMCEWYRVIMDEVQMVGGGKTEEMVSLIPRLTSFAVSGTPARSQVADLIHVLRFLRVSSVIDVPRAWTRLQLPGYVHEFSQLFRRYTVRTMKASVKQELTIPKQTRFLVPIELGRVERHVYDEILDRALLDLGLDARGVAATENWQVDVGKLRHWLRRLRGLCTHPQVGELQVNAADKLHKPGVLKSMSEVLETMREHNWKNYMDDRKAKIAAMTTLAQLLQQDEQNRNRYRQALDSLIEAEEESDKLLADLKDAVSAHAKEGETLKAEFRASRRQESAGVQSDKSQEGQARGKGKGRERAQSPTSDAELDEDEEGIPRNPIGDAHRVKGVGLLQRLREARILLHKIKFLQGDIYHVLGKSHENSESEAYAAAEELRRVLLKGTEDSAGRAMSYLDRDPTIKALKEKDLYVNIPYLGKGAIRSALLMEEGNELIDGLLNEQSALLWQWRQKLIALLTQPLGNSDGDADGQEYSRNLDTQGEAEAYLQAYAALLADRRETLTAERTLLAAHDVREVKLRKTKAARKAQGVQFATIEEGGIEIELEKLDEQEVRPEHEVIAKTLNDERKALLDEFDPGRAVKSIMVDLNNVVVKITKKDDPEKILAQQAVANLRTLINEQGKLIDRLQNDLSHLRKAFNERIAYFRQLQEISDTVAEAEWEGTLQDTIQDVRQQQADLETKIKTARARQRYMDNLSKSHEEGTLDEDDKSCILCKCDFVRGYITQCAHVYCEDCMKAWVVRPEGKACPVCRVPINPNQLQRFSITNIPNEPRQAPAKIMPNNEVLPRSRRKIEYNFVDPQVMEDIRVMESIGSYGSKIETLVRHLLYLEVTDPGSKSIVFSAWADSLLILKHALSANGITSLRIDQNTGRQNAAKKFRTDPTIRVLLLHGERENAGLNVTCASRVFLVESVVHHAFEVQAIARIDRMGQTRPTEVYCYYAEESVERNILDLAAKQGLSLYTRENAADNLNVTPFASDSDKKQVDAPTKKVQKGDFVYKTDDMLAIFFPHMYEDVEYLLSPDELSESAKENGGGPSQEAGPLAMSNRRPVQENAVAGPSRW